MSTQSFTSYIKSFVNAIKFGSDDDYTLLSTDGTQRAYGSATCFDDLVSSLVARRLESTAGALQYNYDNSSITMQRNGNITNTSDRLIFNKQIPHAFKAGSLMGLHIHWEQTDATTREFTVQWRIQENREAKTEAWQTSIIDTNTNNVFPYTSGTINQITTLVDIDLTGLNISDTVQFRLARTDAVNVDLEAVFVDAHIERDGLGSDEPFTKNEPVV